MLLLEWIFLYNSDACQSLNFESYSLFTIAESSIICILLGNIETVKVLLENGARVDVKDGYDCTPLGKAAQKGNFYLILILESSKLIVWISFTLASMDEI